MNRSDLGIEIARLSDLNLGELRALWQRRLGHPAPISLRTKFLVRAIAYQIQVEAYGGLSAATKRRLREIAAAVRTGNGAEAIKDTKIKPGTQLIRHWKNIPYSVIVLDDGFALEGRTYKTLSAIAKAITGTNWNGYTFFGVKRYVRANKSAATRHRTPPLIQKGSSEGDRLNFAASRGNIPRVQSD